MTTVVGHDAQIVVVKKQTRKVLDHAERWMMQEETKILNHSDHYHYEICFVNQGFYYLVNCDRTMGGYAESHKTRNLMRMMTAVAVVVLVVKMKRLPLMTICQVVSLPFHRPKKNYLVVVAVCVLRTLP